MNSLGGRMLKVLSFALISLFMATASWATDGKLIYAKGVVKINGKKIKKLEKINYGDKVYVGLNSIAVIKVNPNSTIKLKAKTEVIIQKPVNKKGKRVNSLYLSAGQAFIKVMGNKTHGFEVKAKNAVMGVRGTQFFAALVENPDEEENVWMCVNEGQVIVQVADNKNPVLVNKGEGILINSDKNPIAKQYEWTKKLNWKMEGKYKHIKDTTNLKDVYYDAEGFEYD
jgi:hypothetical protein